MVAPPSDTRQRSHSGIRSVEEVRAATTRFAAFSRPPSREHGYGGQFSFLTVGPGMVKLGRRRHDTTQSLFGVSRAEYLRDNDWMTTGVQDPERATRGAITGWSQKSRNRMRLTLGSLDYTPLFRRNRQLPKMVTLTLPADWLPSAPNSEKLKRRLLDDKLRRSFRRAWGYDLQGVWKLEFQRRGAPHLHILCAPPSGAHPGSGESFEAWLRRVWSAACWHAGMDEQAVRDHFIKGVHIESTYGLTGVDSKRIADYFAKHGTFSAKEYQNHAPEEWRDADTGELRPGRFWGYWGLKKGDAEQLLGWVGDDGAAPTDSGADAEPSRVVIELQPAARGASEDGKSPIMSEPEAEPLWAARFDGGELPAEVAIARVLRKWARANGKVRYRNRRVQHVDQLTGEVTVRRQRYKSGPFVKRSAGFVSVNDGVAFAEQLHDAIAGVPRTPPPVGVPGLVHVDQLVADQLAARRDRIEAWNRSMRSRSAA